MGEKIKGIASVKRYHFYMKNGEHRLILSNVSNQEEVGVCVELHFRLLSLLHRKPVSKGRRQSWRIRGKHGVQVPSQSFPLNCLHQDSPPCLRENASSLLLGFRVPKCTKTDRHTHTGPPSPPTHTQPLPSPSSRSQSPGATSLQPPSTYGLLATGGKGRYLCTPNLSVP